MYIRRSISKDLTTFRGERFGYTKREVRQLRYRVTVGVGGNIGDVKRRFEHLYYYFKRSLHVELIQTSLILQNPPFGYKSQDDFLNSIVVLKTNMQPLPFLRYLLRVEKRFLRERSFANAPRTLDLDMIFFDNRVIKLPQLIVPHVSWSERDSVLIPLKDIAL